MFFVILELKKIPLYKRIKKKTFSDACSRSKQIIDYTSRLYTSRRLTCTTVHLKEFDVDKMQNKS